jgi:hypothetical protein
MLSNLLIEKTKPQAKTLRLSDGRGMYLEISPTGGKWWRFKYRLAGKEKRISLGVYPDVPLATAREKREEARRQVAAGIDPGEQRKAAKVAWVEGTENIGYCVRPRPSADRGDWQLADISAQSVALTGAVEGDMGYR